MYQVFMLYDDLCSALATYAAHWWYLRCWRGYRPHSTYQGLFAAWFLHPVTGIFVLWRPLLCQAKWLSADDLFWGLSSIDNGSTLGRLDHALYRHLGTETKMISSLLTTVLPCYLHISTFFTIFNFTKQWLDSLQFSILFCAAVYKRIFSSWRWTLSKLLAIRMVHVQPAL